MVSEYLPAKDTSLLAADGGAVLNVHAVHVEIVSGPSRGEATRIDRPSFVIGSGDSADFIIRDDTISREHLRIFLSPEGVILRDEGSTNGTWIGAMRLREVLLRASTSVTLGATALALRIESVVTAIPLSAEATFGNALGVSAGMRHVFGLLERIAPTDTSVLIEGETGVGKEVIAQAIHMRSPRANGPFVAIDCGAIAPSLIESELFGHERGAFTGADRTRMGAFEQAHGGTLFLDEMGELATDLQPKLLRALETREIRPVGASRTKSVDVRVVSATNRKLDESIRSGSFRSDLFYRLAVVRVTVPALRDRREDILPLARAFLRRSPGHENAELPADFAAMLTSYPWPGNVRELRNMVERYTVLGSGANDMLGGPTGAAAGADLSHLAYHEARRVSLDRFDREYFPAVLARANGVIAHAAQLAQVGRGSFHRMLGRMRKATGSPGSDS